MADPRRSHAQKTEQQRRAYVEKLGPEPTVKDPEIEDDSGTSTESLLSQPKRKPGVRRPVKFQTLAREFLEDHWIGILSATAAAILGFLGWIANQLYGINREIGADAVRIEALEKAAGRFDEGLMTLEGIKVRLEIIGDSERRRDYPRESMAGSRGRAPVPQPPSSTLERNLPKQSPSGKGN